MKFLYALGMSLLSTKVLAGPACPVCTVAIGASLGIMGVSPCDKGHIVVKIRCQPYNITRHRVAEETEVVLMPIRVAQQRVHKQEGHIVARRLWRELVNFLIGSLVIIRGVPHQGNDRLKVVSVPLREIPA